MTKPTKLIIAGLSLGLISPYAALATPTGCGPVPATERHYLGGYRVGSGSTPRFWGISGAIETSTLDLCPGTGGIPSATFAWVGIDNNSISTLGWVQLGYVRRSDYSTSRVYFEAQNPLKTGGPNGNGYYFYTLSGTPAGVNTYKVDLEWNGTNASSFWKYYLNGAQSLTLGYSQIPIIPTKLNAIVELTNPSNQVPGTNANHVSFGSLLFKTAQTSSYSALSVFKQQTDSAISSHAQTDMTNPDTAWFVWDSRY